MNTVKRTLLRALVICSVIGIAAFIVLGHDSKSPVQLRLESAAAAGDESFDFAADPTFAWDRMFVFDSYSSKGDVESALGFSWAGYDRTSIARSKSAVLLVFVSGKSVVHWYEQPRLIDLGPIANGKGYARPEATFSIAQDNGSIRLQPIVDPRVAATQSSGF